MRAIAIALFLAASASAHAPYEPEPVQLALDELGVAYPPEEIRYRRFWPEDQDDEAPDHPATYAEAQVYGEWLRMLVRRVTPIASDRHERNYAGHARDELAKGFEWLEKGGREERLRGNAPPRVNPISVAHTIDHRRVDRRAKATSCYTKALRAFHRGSRYAMQIMRAHGLDPTREAVPEEAVTPGPR